MCVPCTLAAGVAVLDDLLLERVAVRDHLLGHLQPLDHLIQGGRSKPLIFAKFEGSPSDLHPVGAAIALEPRDAGAHLLASLGLLSQCNLPDDLAAKYADWKPAKATK